MLLIIAIFFFYVLHSCQGQPLQWIALGAKNPSCAAAPILSGTKNRCKAKHISAICYHATHANAIDREQEFHASAVRFK
jgi:hypothetical protein